MENFIEKVAAMRNAQRNYFRYRGHDYLKEAKKLEKEVDAELQTIHGETSRHTVNKHEHEQPKLF